MEQRVAVVTGSNKGIGFGIVKSLCEKFPGIVYLTARDEARGRAAVEELNTLGFKPRFHQLDVTDRTSIVAFKNHLKQKYGGIDVLVNNAGIAFKRDATVPFGVQAEVTCATNYFALVDVCGELFPLLRPHARVVNVSSSCGALLCIPGKAIRNKFLNPELTADQLSQLIESFVKAAKDGDEESLGWGSNAYVVSKVGVTRLSFIQQADVDRSGVEGVLVNAVHPGYADTDLTSHMGPATTEEASVAPVYLSLLPPGAREPRGAYVWKDKSVRAWDEPPPGLGKVDTNALYIIRFLKI